MSSNINKVFRRTALAAAFGVCFASTAFAQSNTTGTVYGTAQPGATIVVKNDAGLERRVVVGADGRYRTPPVPGGNYIVTEERDGQVIDSRPVTVSISSGVNVSFEGAPVSTTGATNVGTVTVRGARSKIDMSQVDTRTVFTASDLAKLPVSRDVSAVALLAPSVVVNTNIAGANGKTSAPSFGGSTVSENAYYINGFPVTDPLKNIGFNTLPFDGISQMQVLTGGYGAEFGRSTGGVINMVTKSGTNDYHGGVGLFYTPASLKGDPVDVMYPDTGSYPNTDGLQYQYRAKNKSDQYTLGMYMGGPIVKDRLFFYVSSEYNKTSGVSNGAVNTAPLAPVAVANGWNNYSYTIPRWMAKVDWRINDMHSLEFTAVSDKTRYDSATSSFNYADLTHSDVITNKSGYQEASMLRVGKYTGYLTDNLTVSALYGTLRSNHDDLLSNPYRADCPRISGVTTVANQMPGIVYPKSVCQTLANKPVVGYFDETKGGRFDVTYTLANHTFRVGADDMTTHSVTGDEYAGGYIWVYGNTANKNGPIDSAHGVGSPASAGGSGLGVPGSNKGYFVRRQYYTHFADIEVKQRSFYLEDNWQITPNVLLYLGLRNENFTNYNSEGQAFVEQKNQWDPRLGLSWDIGGAGTTKLFANAGRYHLALPNNVAVRGAAKSTYTLEYFTYTGVDPITGAPTGLNNVPVTPNPYLCPGSTTVWSSNLECGDSPDPKTVAAKDIKSHFQDEFILGMEHSFSPTWRAGVKGTYRTLRNAIDDTCNEFGCFLFNPGKDNTYIVDEGNGNYSENFVSAEESGMPALKRKYTAVDFFVEHAFTNNWYGKLEYTWSRNWGNTEGQVASDLDTGGGTGQAEPGQTQDWDLPQLMVNASGLLPNHRAHQIKGFGYYQISPSFRVGATLIAASGRPRNCTSFYPTADAGLYNGAYYWFCGLAGTGKPGTAGNVPPSADYGPSPRGSHGTTPWTYQLNLSASYVPAWGNKQLTFTVDALNVLDRQTPQLYNPRYASDRFTVNYLYGQAQNYTAPRSVRFSVRWDF